MNYLREITLYLQRTPIIPFKVRRLILLLCGYRIGPNTSIEAGAKLVSPNITVGSGTYVNFDLLVDGTGEVTIGTNVTIGPGVKLITSTHDITDDPMGRASRKVLFRSITIEDGVWLGANVVVLPGLTITNGCVIAAGALVTKDTLPNGLYAGIPARRIRDLPIKPSSDVTPGSGPGQEAAE